MEIHRFRSDGLSSFVLDGLLFDWPRHQIRLETRDNWLVVSEYRAGSDLDTEYAFVTGLAGGQFPGVQMNQPLKSFKADRLAEVALHYYQNYRVPAKVMVFEELFERLKLHDKPNSGSKVLGQYFSDVVIDEVLEKGPEWSHVSIGGRQGYMKNEFLVYDALIRTMQPGGAYGIIMKDDRPLTLYKEPDTNSAQIQSLEDGIYLSVLDTVGEDWLHVALPDPWWDDGVMSENLFMADRNQIVSGFVSNRLVRYTDNFASCFVATKSPGDKLHLREQPSLDSRSLGMYFYDVGLYRLFDDHVINDGFDRVRIGDQISYMKESLLSYRSAGNAPFLLPLSTTQKDTALLAEANRKAQVLHPLTKGTRLQVLGTVGSYYHVKLSPTWDGVIGYVLQMDVNKVTKAVSAQVKIKDGAVIYEFSPDKVYVPWPWQTESGLDKAKGLKGIVWTYIDKASGYAGVSFDSLDGYYHNTHFRLEDLQYDAGLVW